MGLLSRGSDEQSNDCGHHHWGEYYEDWDSISTSVEQSTVTFQNEPGGFSEEINVVTIKVPLVRQCQHQDCHVTDRRGVPNHYQIPMSLLSVGCHLRLLAHLSDSIHGEHGEEIGYALIGRANDIHENPDDDFEHVAEHLKALGEEVLKVLDTAGE